MIYVDGLPILEDELTIIGVLKQQVFEKTGRVLFAKYRLRNDELQVCCPFHKNGQERRPSATISLKDKKGENGRKIEAGTFHCFACGETCDITRMISHCLGYTDDLFGLKGRQWLLENFTRAFELSSFSLPELQIKSITKKNSSYISEDELDSYRFVHPYMYKRGLDDELIDIFDVGYDPNFVLKNKNNGKETNIPSITFPVRDIDGNVLFIARRSIKGKIFHYPQDAVKPIYGIYELFQYWDIGKIDNGEYKILDELYVVESIFNCITCWKYHVPAVALLGTGTPQQIKTIERLPVKKYILGHDPDEAGDRGIDRFIKNCYKTNIEVMDIPQGKDINDLTEEEFWGVKRIPIHKLSK